MIKAKVNLKFFLFVAGLCLSGAANADGNHVGLAVPAAATTQLAQTLTLDGSVHVSAGYAGTISLSTDLTALTSAYGDSSGATLTLTPASFSVAASDQERDLGFKITIQTVAQAHSFHSLPMVINVKADGMNSNIAQTLLLTVNPVLEIDLTGGPIPEGWSTPMTLTLPKHDDGTTLHFVNLDTKSSHTIHGEGAIPHEQDTMAAATMNQPGGTYDIKVPAGAPVSGRYRCHDHETEDMLRVINFNN